MDDRQVYVRDRFDLVLGSMLENGGSALWIDGW